MAVAKDGSTVGINGSFVAVSTLTTGAFSTSGTNRLCIASLTVGGNNATPISGLTLTGTTLSWSILKQSPNSFGNTSFILWAWAAASVTGETLLASWTTAQFAALAVQPFSGSQNYSGLVSGTDYAVASASTTSSSGADSATNIITKKNGSWVLGCTGFWNTPAALTADSGCDDLYNFQSAANQFTSDFIELTASPVNAGTYSLGANAASQANGWTIALAEIVPGGVANKPYSFGAIF